MKWALYLLLAWTLPALASTPWGGDKSDSIDPKFRHQVLKEFKTDTSLLTLLHVRPWKSYPNRYVAFGCFAVDSDAYFHANNDYSENGKFHLEPNCKVDHYTIQRDEYIVQKNTELMVFDLDSLGKIHIRQRAINITDPWIAYDRNAMLNVIHKDSPQGENCYVDENGNSIPKSKNCFEPVPTLFDELLIEAMPGFWSTPQPDEEEYGGYPLTYESLDLAPYCIKDSTVALGLRISGNQTFAGSGYQYSQFLLLFEPRGDSLVPVMATLMASENQIAGEFHKNAPRDLSGQNESIELRLCQSKNTGYKDLELWSQGQRVWDMTRGRSKSTKSKRHLWTRLAWDPVSQFYVEKRLK